MRGMNSNSLAASLTDGYGRPVSADMLDALGIGREDEYEAPRRPTALTFEARRVPFGRAANSNLRRAV